MAAEAHPAPPPANLFTPSFGHSPHQMVGRDALLRSLYEAMQSGSGHKHRSTLVMGPRASGKTVMLNAVEEMAAELGYVTISVDAGTAGVAERILRRIDRAAAELQQGTPRRQPETRTKAGLHLGPLSLSHERKRERSASPTGDIREALDGFQRRVIAEGAAGVLLTVDEMHRVDIGEMIRLANDLQHVTTRAEAAVMFVGASLPDIKSLLDDDRLSFFRRCADEDLAPLDTADAYAFITGTMSDAGGDYDPDAVYSLAETAGPLPYEMQLLGDYAWRFAGAPMRPIGHEAVEAALRSASAEMHRKVYAPLWARLSSDERQVITEFAGNEGCVTRQHLGQALTGMIDRLGDIVRSLEYRACLAAADDSPDSDPDLLCLGPALSLAAAQHEARIETAYRQNAAYTGPAGPTGTRLPRCAKLMPRAKKRCVLRRGHSGGCKSRI
ncbi:MAG: ATP-binding protein [Acidimicrobiaceae bacterium]|nr:ATP-binding protein [Acidimicrobiaceae bacterium]